MKKRNLVSLTLNKKTILKLNGGKQSPNNAPLEHSGVQGCQGTATRYPCSS
jgi:hypothetical protein